MPFESFNITNPRTNPVNFHKKYGELAILKNEVASDPHDTSREAVKHKLKNSKKMHSWDFLAILELMSDSLMTI